MKKKIFSLLLIAIMLLASLFVFAGCGDDEEEDTKSSKNNKAESSQVENKKDNDDDSDDDNRDNDYDDDDDIRGSSESNTIKSDSNTISGNSTSNDSSTSNEKIVKITGTNSELSELAGQIQGISYGDVKVEIEYDKSKEEILGIKLSMSMEVTDSQMLAALDGVDLNSLFESSLSDQEYVKNAKTERVGNTIYFTADMDVEAAMADAGTGTNKISLEELKESMTDSSFVVTVEE